MSAENDAENPEKSQEPEKSEQAVADDVTSGPVGSPGSKETDVSAELQRLEAELAAERDQALRAQAEIQNIRRRAERDVESASKFAIERFSAALIPVVDNFERAMALMEASNEETRALFEGIELTHRNFLDVLKRFGIEAVDPVGEPFDPAVHEAMSTVENDEVEPNTVLQVVQKGYTLNGRVLRAAMVMVARPKAKVDETA